MKTCLLGLLTLLTATVAGCQSSPKKQAAAPVVVQGPFVAPPAPLSATGPVPFALPPPPAPINPPSVNPPAPMSPSTVPPPPVPPSADIRNFAPQGEPKWQPADSTPATTAEPPRISVLLLPPEPLTDPKEIAKLKADKEPGAKLLSPEPLDKKEPAPKPANTLPVGIPQFTLVQGKDKVAAGLRPSLDEGLDWLQSNGYRTVLLVRLPGEEDQADKKQVEKRGMKFISLEVSPLTLSKEIVDDFNRMVADKNSTPLFVYDRDGALAGGLWYLHFRIAEVLPDDAARLRSGSLGLREDRDGSHRDMWLAIQKYLEKR